ncbi:40251_t:CDS:2 [Gigaspora margarita]|uniref:40251_t:CDS:1 n=1 Tax=Gigaspora margarita TaxID=4874 RepID=A0ABN7WBL0_GIGMA|nr:40251_t:CDS:2 [Gigaspora margarita]
MEAINKSFMVVICGETESGKTTQLTQFLYEAGNPELDLYNPGIIGITQPHRVATMELSFRRSNSNRFANNVHKSFHYKYISQ